MSFLNVSRPPVQSTESPWAARRAHEDLPHHRSVQAGTGHSFLAHFSASDTGGLDFGHRAHR